MKMKLQPQRITRTDSAYSLAEVMVAVGVLLTVSVAFYAALSFSFSIAQTTRDNLRGTQILTQKSENLRLCTWSELTNFTFQDCYYPQGATNGNGGTAYFGSVSFAPATNLPATAAYRSNMCLVTLTLIWTNYSGNKPLVHTRQMQTQIARYGLQNYIWGLHSVN